MVKYGFAYSTGYWPSLYIMTDQPKQKGKFLPDGSFELKVPYSDDRELIMDIWTSPALLDDFQIPICNCSNAIATQPLNRLNWFTKSDNTPLFYSPES
jgi:hypothetical protein